jgi:hypothetical protein
MQVQAQSAVCPPDVLELVQDLLPQPVARIVPHRAGAGPLPHGSRQVLAAAGETNPRKRWHLQLLRRHGTEFGDETVEALIRLLCEWPMDEPHDAIRRAWEISDGLLEAVVRQRPELSASVNVATKGM